MSAIPEGTSAPPTLCALASPTRLTLNYSACNIDYMEESRPISDALRRAIAEGEMSFKALERETGVLRQSLMKFARGEQCLRGDAYDKLASYFGLALQPIRKNKAVARIQRGR